MVHATDVSGSCKNHLLADYFHIFTAIMLFPLCDNPHAPREESIHLQNDSFLYQLCLDITMHEHRDFVSHGLLF